MQTEFKNLTFDQLRYSIVWEDHRTLYDGLDIQDKDQVAVITSAGDNVLNTLLKNPLKVVAIDLNLHQNALLDFKRYIIKNHDYKVYRALLGLEGIGEVSRVYRLIANDLCLDSKVYWDLFFKTHPEGIMQSGKLESYLTAFVHQLSSEAQELIIKIGVAANIEDQKRLFEKLIGNGDFKESFISYVDKKNLGKARDPKLFKYAGEGVGKTFFQCLKRQSETVLWRNNFHWQFFFFGADQLRADILPPCYREENYACLKDRIDRLEIQEGEIVNYLLSDKGKDITKASLSNVFEYASPEEFESVILRLGKVKRKSNLSILYWNLLQHQVVRSTNGQIRTAILPENDKSCFYFKNTYQVLFHESSTK